MATSITEPTKKSQKVSHDTTLKHPSTVAASSPSTTNSPKSSTSAAVRHLEKRRNSTCRFADRVARVALDEYRKRIPIQHQQPATCIAAVVAHDANQHEEDRQLVVVGLGVGTKFLTQETLLQETNNENYYYGRRVRDCHAEVLARRAFRRQLLWMIYQDLQPPPTQQENEIKRRTNNCDKPHLSTSNYASLPNWLLQRVPSVIVDAAAATPSYTSPNDPKHQPTTTKHAHCYYYYSLRPGVTLHMYSSTTPCGNAALKKFAKMEKERFLEHLGDNEWPTSPPHPVVEPHSWKLGQFSLLLKRDTQATASEEESTAATNDSTTRQDSTTGKPTKMTGHPLEQACPPGTCTVGNDRGVVHTCSDKICRWNCLGLQGSLLSSLLQEPLYLSTLTVGRKLTACICRRAVCCRVGKDGDKVIGWPQSQLPTSSSQRAVLTTSLFHLVHPAVMGTSVYVDEDAAIDMSANDHGVKGQDVRFHSSLSWAWWPGKEFETTQDAAQGCSKAECIDGSTGFCGDPTVSVEAKGPHSSLANLDDDPVVSRVSTAALSRLFLEIKALRASLSPEQLDAEGRLTHIEVASPTSLVELLSLKQRVAPLYEAAKEELLTRHPVLRNWKRRAIVRSPGNAPPTNTKEEKLQDARKQQQHDES